MKRSHGEMSGAADGKDDDSTTPKASSSPQKSYQPKISRKIRACQECQSRKIKCGIEPGENACSRCKRLSLKCVVNKSLQTLLEDESGWKVSMEQKTSRLQQAVSQILRHMNLPDLGTITPTSASPLQSAVEHISQNKYAPEASPPARHPQRMDMTREASPESSDQVLPDEAALVAAPMTSLFEVTKLRNLRSNVQTRINQRTRTALREDFVSQGRVSLAEAEDLFQRFCVSLNQYLWGGIALLHDTLTAVRESSSLLLAAILAVTALHVPGKEEVFDVAYAEFLALVSESMFDRYHNLDDVRAFCIGAFWLSDVSWKLSGHAVRIATELNLHQSFSKAIRGQAEHIERARLWYFLYVCDHHFSIAYGRPPVIHDDTTISCHETFLQVPGIGQADWRLHSQIAVFHILSRIYLRFGSDSEKPLSEDDFDAIRSFNADLDAWRTKWEPSLAPNKYVSSYPARGVIMHWNYGKLQLNSLSLRGLPPQHAHLMSEQRREFANLAISNAVATLSFILEDPSIRTSIIGVPLYLHTMITLATVFLLKVHSRWKGARLNTDLALALSLIERVIDMLAMAKASERHLTYYIARGLSKMLQKFKRMERLTDPSAISGSSALSNNIMSMNATAGSATQQQDWSSLDSGSDTLFGPGSSDAVMDLYGFGQEYFQLGVFDALTMQMPG